MEGGLQYSFTYDNYSPFIRVNGGAMKYEDINGNQPKRFKSNTTLVHRLRYEHANSKVKYYANGTAVDGTAQGVIFAADKTFTSTQQSKLRAGRVTGLATKFEFNGSQKLGKVDVTYSNVKLQKIDNSEVSLNTSQLDQWIVNNKIC